MIVQGPRDTLLLLVTCSRDEERRGLATKVMTNLAELVPAAGLQSSFIVFDNASTFPDHLALAPEGTVVCRGAQNSGYWSAIKWVLESRWQLLERDFKYLYIVESDLVHSDLRPLGDCERFLESEPLASGVRTQEFSVRWRFRFDKRLRRLPFHVERSAIAMTNQVSGEAAWFRPAIGQDRLYLSNLHPKLPALNRLSALDVVFERLALLQQFTEADFFREMMSTHPLIGVLDGGLFHSLISYSDRKRVVMGSYTNPADLARLGYAPTRTTSIRPLAAGEVDIYRRPVPVELAR